MPIPWRPAKALVTLRSQVKAAWPGTPNPGMIGDADHASRDSDHNPWVDDPTSSLNVVTAGDWYNRPSAGFSSAAFAEALRKSRDPRIKYVISDRRIFRSYGKTVGRRYYAPFTWAPYDGNNPHVGHTHVSVSSTKSLYDSTRAWDLSTMTGAPSGGDPTPPPTEDDVSPEQMQELKNAVEMSCHRWALWGQLYEIETADDVAAAQAEFETRIEAGDTPAQAQAAVAAKLSTLRAALKKSQAEL